jgi:hypothetical protein
MCRTQSSSQGFVWEQERKHAAYVSEVQCPCWDDPSIGDPNVPLLLQKAKLAIMIKVDSGGASLQDRGIDLPDGGLGDSGGNLDLDLDSEEEDYEVD